MSAELVTTAAEYESWSPEMRRAYRLGARDAYNHVAALAGQRATRADDIAAYLAAYAAEADA